MTAPANSVYAAQFTDMAQVICERPQCPTKVFPAGFMLRHMESLNKTQAGRNLCPDCYQYYLNKTTTVHRSIPSTFIAAIPIPHQQAQSGQQGSIDHEGIRRQLAEAQRGKIDNEVQAVGPKPTQVGYVTRAQAGPTQTLGPNVHLPGQAPSLCQGPGTRPIPTTYQTIGYTAHHASYAADRAKRIQQAYTDYNGEVVNVNVRMVVLHCGRVRATVIGNLVEAVDHIPVHIGAVALKKTLFDTIYPRWLKWSKGFTLSIDQIVMRNNLWAVLRAKDPDCDVISEYFFKKGKKAPVFKGGSCVVQFEVPNEIMEQCNIHLDGLEVEEAKHEKEKTSKSVAAAEFTVAASRSKGKKRARSPSPSFSDIEPSSSEMHALRLAKRTKPTSAPSSSTTHFPPRTVTCKTSAMTQAYDSVKRTITKSKTCSISPSARRISEALKSQKPPTNLEIRSFFGLNVFNVLVYPVKTLAWEQLIEGTPRGHEELSASSEGPEKDWYLDSPLNTSLRLDLTPTNTKKGGFKLAAFGSITSTIPNFGHTTNICAKRTFYEKTTVVEVQGKLTKKTCTFPHDGRVQFRHLTMEISCLVWARALLKLVYDFIGESCKDYGNSPLPIPRFRFVESALAVDKTVTGNLNDATLFLIEEVIDDQEQGTFRKYLNNVSPVPFTMKTKADRERADFLAFSQHVQYWKTKRLVFVSDYQGKQTFSRLHHHYDLLTHRVFAISTGGNSLLTDPQISSDSALGVIFAEGNVPSIHATFEEQHVCNIYCQWFKVPTQYEDE